MCPVVSEMKHADGQTQPAYYAFILCALCKERTKMLDDTQKRKEKEYETRRGGKKQQNMKRDKGKKTKQKNKERKAQINKCPLLSLCSYPLCKEHTEKLEKAAP
jgi:dynactin complex subunit